MNEEIKALQDQLEMRLILKTEYLLRANEVLVKHLGVLLDHLTHTPEEVLVQIDEELFQDVCYAQREFETYKQVA